MAFRVWSSLRTSRAGLYALPVIAIAGCAVWLMLPQPSDAQNTETAPAQNAFSLNPAVTSPQTAVLTSTEPEPSNAAVGPAGPQSVAASPLDGLKIASQSWRRGGLGSKALVTFTVRNANDYPVKDIEIACSFTRRDGSHLTDRKRLISDTVDMKSRKTFAKLHVGFVNVNADKAKCALVTASRASAG